MNKFHVGIRTLKTVLAVTLAIFVSQQLGLKSVTLAAIVALLTVQRTFYHSLLQSLVKLGSVLLGGLLGTIFGYIFGVTPLAYGLVTLAAIFICLKLHREEFILLTTVTAIGVIFSGTASLEIYSLLQILTAMIGAASALLMNYLFTPDHKQEVIKRLQEVDAGLCRLIGYIIQEIQEPGSKPVDSFKDEVSRIRKDIEEGADIAKLLRDEQRFIVNRETPSDRYRQVFHIFDSQLERLEEMHRLARRMPVKVPQAIPLIKLFRIAKRVQYNRLRGKKSAYARIEQLIENLDNSFAQMELPQTREEFISRASLFHLFQEIKRYYRRTQKIHPVAEGTSLTGRQKIKGIRC